MYVGIYVYVYIYTIYIYINLSLFLSLSLYTCIYIIQDLTGGSVCKTHIGTEHRMCSL